MLFTEKWVINELTRIVKSYPPCVDILSFNPAFCAAARPRFLLFFMFCKFYN